MGFIIIYIYGSEYSKPDIPSAATTEITAAIKKGAFIAKTSGE
jgi:hypothetical protein